MKVFKEAVEKYHRRHDAEEYARDCEYAQGLAAGELGRIRQVLKECKSNDDTARVMTVFEHLGEILPRCYENTAEGTRNRHELQEYIKNVRQSICLIVLEYKEPKPIKRGAYHAKY